MHINANFVKIKQPTQLLPIVREFGLLLDAGIKARVLLTKFAFRNVNSKYVEIVCITLKVVMFFIFQS